MSVDKIFEALSSATRRHILGYLSKTDMTAGEMSWEERFSGTGGEKQNGLPAAA